MAQRICFQLQVRPDQVEEYVRRHQAVWPEMRAALAESGWHNYSLFISPPGTVVGYLECDDFEAARRAMERTEVNARWQADMAPFFQDLTGRRADEEIAPLQEIFHLE
jgi:L-rhamnose mutarotase